MLTTKLENAEEKQGRKEQNFSEGNSLFTQTILTELNK